MIHTGFESRVKVQDILISQLPDFIMAESPKTLDFLKQYYISQEFQGAPTNIVENLDQYLKLDNLTPDVIVGSTELSFDIESDSSVIYVSSTSGFPEKYGLLKIDDEIITYTGKDDLSFTGCVRGFSGITSYHAELDEEELVFSSSTAGSHSGGVSVENLSSLFLKEFYRKLKYTFAPGFEERQFVSDLDVGNFVKQARNFYESKGTENSFEILFRILFGEDPKVINLEERLLKPSSAEFIRREIVIAEAITGNPLNLIGQTIFKNDDADTNASISEVDIFTRKGVEYYKLALFVGYSESSAIQGTFEITPNTKSFDEVTPGSTVITVDSTIGFSESGTIQSGNNVITYTEKNINQFLGCSGISETINKTDNIFSQEKIYFGYENGERDKPVQLRLTGIVSDFKQKSSSVFASEGQILTVRNIGDKIENFGPGEEKTYKQIFANSWIYNSSSSIEIDSFSGSTITLKKSVDRSQLKKGDQVEIIDRSTNSVVYPTTDDIPYVNQSISFGSKTVILENFSFIPGANTLYSLRRRINKSNSEYTEFKYGNDTIISDIQNLYSDGDFAYVASNSLPSAGVAYTDFTHNIKIALNESILNFDPNSPAGQLTDFDVDGFTTISFDKEVDFVTGDRIYYQPTQNETLGGLEVGFYYVEVLANRKNIKLYSASSSVGKSSNVLKLSNPLTELSSHIFTIDSQNNRLLNSQNILKKFPLYQNIENGTNEDTLPGSTGMLINGVEILNYKTTDIIYYGPVDSVSVVNSGSGYDVINPPQIEISSGLGSTALANPILSGTITDIFVDQQEFDIDEVLSVNVSGGNISGGKFEPIVTTRRREILFDARSTSNGGGISTTTAQLTFLKNHNLSDGDEVFYNNNGNPNVSIGIGLSSLTNQSSYFIAVDNNTTIRLFDSYDNYLVNNPISFATTSLSGTHKFTTGNFRKTVSEIKVVDGGSLTNRELYVKSSGISTTNNLVNFKNHGFKSGELVEYVGSQEGTIGISTNNLYYTLKIDDDSFRLCDAGIGGTITENLNQEKFVKFSYTGNGYQIFKYPDITVTLEYTSTGIGTTQSNSINLTPVVKGEIVDLSLYETGTGYGSSIINEERLPQFTIKNGKEAQVEPIIVNGSITDINLQFGGFEYFSVPNLEIRDPSGKGTGAKLRAIVSDGELSDVKIVNPGIGYSTSSTINVVSSGSNAQFTSSVRKLYVNNIEKTQPNPQYQTFENRGENVQYFISGYSDDIRKTFVDNGNAFSKIIGWAYDGNPIYGSFGYNDPNDSNLGIKTLTSGYSKDLSNIFDRPSGFDLGFFVDDYRYDASGDLDINNGRFAKTPEFPEGIYAYHATINPDTLLPEFPYFIGNSFRSKLVRENEILNQSFDFNNSSLIRNTYPHNISETFADNNFIVESDEIVRQKTVVESISKGSVSGFDIINPGDDYKVGDELIFDNENTGGGQIKAQISAIQGKSLNQIDTSIETFSNTIFIWNKSEVKGYVLPYHNLQNLDYITVSGFGTSKTSKLNDYHQITINPNPIIGLTTEIVGSGSTSTEIYVTNIPSNVSSGNSIGIGTEILEVLNVYPNKNILRVKRGLVGTSHTVGESVVIKNNSFTIDLELDYFESNLNEKIYFNPKESVGLGTTAGVGYSTSFAFGNESISRDIPTQRLYIENHPFRTNQEVTFNSNGHASFSIGNSPTDSFPIPSTLYIVNKSPNTIGVKTGITSEFGEVYFRSNGENFDDYYFETTYKEELGDIEKVTSTVSVSTSHGLSDGDTISLTVKPNLSVGIGTSTAVRVLYKSAIENIVINPIGFNSTGVSKATNEIIITDHELVTGDKVFYEDDTFEYLVDTNDQIDTTAQDGVAESVFFKPDGTKMYVVGRSADEVNEYELSTPWSPSTATFTNALDVTTENTNPTGIYIRDDGLKFWICGYTNPDRIYQYSMSTAWDISTASYDNVSLLVGSGNSLGFTQSSPQGIYFKYDGTVLYIIGSSGDFIHQLDLSTAWDITTASYSGNTTGRLDINPPDATPSDIQINSSGTIVYWVGVSADSLYIYELSTPWDITTGVEIDRFAFTNPYGVYVSPDEENFYIVSNGNDIVKRYRRPSPLTESEYFIYKVDENTIKFCDTFKNANSNPPIVVSFASTGSSSQTISLINPQIQTVKNNNLVFDLSDSSLSGYEFKIYYDQEFNNEFVSTGSTSTFNISGVGTVGIASTASLTINYSSNFPQNLYYSLEKSGYISTSDKDVLNHSEISYIDSGYNGEYKVSDVGITTFKISLENNPEKSSYVKSDCNVFEYFTTSTSASGPAEKIKLISGGSGYSSLPVLDRTESDNGKNLTVDLKSNSIGNIESVRVINQGFEYSSDRTLEPQTFISPKLSLESSNKIASVNVVNGGKGFVVAPDIIAVNSDTREAVTNGLLVPDIVATSISTVDTEVPTKGISDAGVELFSVNNSNGISIKQVTSTPTGIFTCSITTPSSGFSTNPFKSGDQVFIEGIQKFSSDGDGFNSSDYGYKFFNVKFYDTSFTDHQVTIDISNLTTNTGIAKTIQDSFGVIINKNDYPVFEITTEPSFFTIGETLISNGIERELSVVNHDINTPLKLAGNYDLSANEKITGKLSGNSAIVKSIINYSGNFDIDYSSKKNQGWTDEIGKLNEDHQVLSDNDYYQNLSYSVKSSQQWKDIRTPVNSLVHISGLKNFSDTEILTVADKIGLGGTDQTTVIRDYFSENRVDTINIFDFVKDIDTFGEKSKFIKLLNKKLTNFTEIGSNIVLRIDDISSEFSNFDSEPNPYVDLVELNNSDSYLNYLIKVSDLSGNEIQLTNVIIVNDNIKNNSFILEKQSLTNLTSNTQYGDFSIESNSFGERYLRFTPEDPFNTEYDIKYIEKRFISGTGIGTTSVGFVDLTSNKSEVSSGTTSTVLEFSASDISSFFVSANIIQTVTNEINFVELYVTHDGTNTNISEYYIANDLVSGASFDQIGVGFTANISSGTLSLDYYNDSSLDITIDSRSIGFSTPPGVGIGSTYRFLADAQPEGSERSAIYESIKYSTSSGLSTTVVSLDKNLFDAVNSIVEITTGSTKSTHQVFLVQDGTDIYTQQYSIISIGSTIGIGTFGGEYVGTDNFELKFYPDSNFTGNIDVLSLNECLYKTVDFDNQYFNLNFGFSNESVKSTAYFAINGDRTNRVNFKLNNNSTPIFAKTFNPSKSNVLNTSTGTFTIENNFFSNGEELVYTPGSTFVGVGSTSMLFDNGSFVAELPSQVFAVVGSGNTNNFQISTTRSGSPITFASVGEGNAHKFAMAKRNEKAIITIDNIVQYPIAFTKIIQNLTKNISETDTFFTLSGITTINPLDILRIDDEYMNIINVGLGTVDVGPITNTGSELLVEVERGFVGSSASSHTNTTPTRIYKGSYNIVGDEIYFTKPPRGNPTIVRDGNNLVQETSDFTGRVFLRSNYDTSQVYDDISDEFTGIGRTFTLTVGGANTTGIGSTGGNGIVFLNGIFQTPTTSNNPENNFQIIDNSVIGISSIVFSGIRTDIDDPNSNLIIESDVNQNQLPRGGIIVSLGSSGGLGYAPLAGAAVTAVISSGVIQNSIGIGTTDISGSGYNNVISIGVTAFDPNGSGSGALISASVGVGGTLSFNVTNGGSGYSDQTRIYVSEPSYENLEVTGISRLGVGSTTETGIGLLLDVEVGASSTTGIGSTYFEVTNFSIKRNGYSFRKGDIFTPVGLVTDGRLSSPLSQFQLTVLDTFSDNFGAWQFGELDFIDSLKNYQDGVRVTFPLFYNSSLLSFELSEDNTSIELANSLIIFINGVLQDPGVSYTFEGGTSFTFSTAPKPEDNIAVFFYRGTRGLDDLLVTNVLPTLEKGDFVRVYKNNNINGTETQNQRTVFDLSFSDKFETNPYTSQGIDISNPKPMSWTKQKSDRIINGEFVYKTRQSIISQIYPTAKVIDSFSTSDTELFVDDADLFDYDSPDPFNAILVDNKEISKGEVTATISGGKVDGLSITNSGSGYEPGATINIGFAAPLTIGVGVGTTATATITVNSSGSLTSPTITNPGLGYTTAPLTIVPAPESNIESIPAINSVKGFSGIITGIEATTNGGQSALKFNLKTSGIFNNGTNTLSVGYPILVKNTNVGSGAVSVDSTDSDIVAIGTAFFDNIYYVHQISDDGGLNGIATCNISSSTDTSSLPVSGDIVGEFSWGRLGITQRSTGPISIAVTGKTVDVGLSTFPTIQRRSQGLRQTGSIIERLD